MKSVFNSAGVPLLFTGKSYLAQTRGAPLKKINATATTEPKPEVSKQTDFIEDKVTSDKFTIVSWGTNNDFPDTANTVIRRIGVLNTGLKFLRNLTIGQGIFPCRVTGFDEAGNEILEIVNDAEVVQFCQSRMVRRYLEKLARDYFKYGAGTVQLLLNEDKSKMVGINTLNALHSRYTEAVNGVIENVVMSGKWPDTPTDIANYEIIPLLDDYDPAAQLLNLKAVNKLSPVYAIAIRDSWSNEEYYSEPIWLSAHNAGWTEIARVVPLFLKKAYENRITLKWHIQIPYAFWDKKFPQSEYDSVDARKTAINTYMDDIEDNLTGVDNADKPIFTFFDINANGKAEEQWIFTPLNGKEGNDENLFTSAAANSEILFSLMINPNVMGAGMPGGVYSGSSGGSNIREGFLVNIANSWIDKQNLLDPLEVYLAFNGITDVQLRFRNTILTTLDTGAGTTKKLS
jgi:hypothetical protein